jgi:hypothetical protein
MAYMRRLALILAVVLAGWWLWPGQTQDSTDRTRISAGVTRQQPVVLQLAYTDAEGCRERVLVDAERYSAFLRRAVETLESARVAAGESMAPRVESRTAPAFDAMAAAVPGFVDWYLRPSTGVQLLSAASGAWRPGRDVATEMKTAVLERYRAAVLQPAEHDARLRQAFLDLLRDAETERDVALRQVDRDFDGFVANERARGVQGQPVVELDWRAQARRLDLPGLPGFAGTPVRDELAARLAGPAIGVVVAGATGAATGAAMGGLAAPVGALVGTAVAVVADRIVAETRRGEVEQDVRATLDAMQRDWRGKMRVALTEAVDAWFDDAIQLLPRFDQRFDQNGRRALSAAVSVPSSR